MADEEVPLEVDDILEDEEAEEPGEKEEPEEKPGRPTKDVKSEPVTKEEVSSYESRAAAAKERAAKPPEPAKDFDVAAWQARMFQEYGDLRNPASDFSRIQAMELEKLHREKYMGPDIDYIASQRAAVDPRITRTASADRARERRVGASSQFERPSSQSEGERRRRVEEAGPDLTEREMSHAKNKAGIKDKAALRAVAEGLAEVRRMQ